MKGFKQFYDPRLQAQWQGDINLFDAVRTDIRRNLLQGAKYRTGFLVHTGVLAVVEMTYEHTALVSSFTQRPGYLYAQQSATYHDGRPSQHRKRGSAPQDELSRAYAYPQQYRRNDRPGQ